MHVVCTSNQRIAQGVELDAATGEVRQAGTVTATVQLTAVLDGERVDVVFGNAPAAVAEAFVPGKAYDLTWRAIDAAAAPPPPAATASDAASGLGAPGGSLPAG